MKGDRDSASDYLGVKEMVKNSDYFHYSPLYI